ncbi:hypothetical protein E4U42_006161 [Claviceps africana]|uniref:Uncharacterized protein n=1 Tax=Claviceps africana TaxID=83212 RepID=A0A8K0J3B8_9HYPO|nr:hypothetical protein E4U42_006161 [Claviceps africana]
MDDASLSSSSFTTPVLHVVRSVWSIPWAAYAAFLASAVLFPLHVLWTPVSYLLGLLQTVFAPVGYVLDYAGGWVSYVAGFLISLEPLYTFFSIAAFIGILAGILAALMSAFLTTSLDMHDDFDDGQVTSLRSHHKKRLQNQSRKEQYLQDQYLSRADRTLQQQQFGLESDWNWADPTALASPHKASRFRRISSLQAETIHEEEDDDSEQ